MSFLFESEIDLINDFLAEGHLVRPAEDLPGLAQIQQRAAEIAAIHLGIQQLNAPGLFLFDGASAEDIYASIADDACFVKVALGGVLVFSQTLVHSNQINREAETRWSMNCRFKSITSPYVDKKLGEFFEPITFHAATRLGLDYELPEGFRG